MEEEPTRVRRKQFRPTRYSPPPLPSRCRKKKCSIIGSDDSGGDILSDGSLFRCDKCSSVYLDSRARGPYRRSKVIHPTMRYSSSGEQLLYCRMCGIEFDKEHAAKNNTGDEVVQGPEIEFQSSENLRYDEFISRLAANTNIENASVLRCYNPSNKCYCMSKHLMSFDDLISEVKRLLELSNRALHLKSLKHKNPQTHGDREKVGLGNGKKRSELYESFVMTERLKLRGDLKLCEHTTQKLLSYSNNFLHKSLATEQKRRRVGGKGKSNLLPVTLLWKQQCCRDECTRVTRSHLNLVVKWRQLSEESRRGLQQAVAELLTPTAGAKSNCYKFITMVTGCSAATIAKISKKIRKNGGVLGMHEHGLRKYWRVKRQIENGEGADDDDESSEEDLPSVWSLPQHHADEVQLRQTLDKRDKELYAMRAKIEEQAKLLKQQSVVLSRLQPSSNVRSAYTASKSTTPSHAASHAVSEETITQSQSHRVSHAITSLPTPQSTITSPPLLQPSRLEASLRAANTAASNIGSFTVASTSLGQFEQRQPLLESVQYFYQTSTGHNHLSQTGHSQTGLSQTGLSQTGLSQTGLSQTGLSQTGLSQTGLSQTGLSQTGLSQTGLSQTGLSQTGLSQTGLSQTGLSQTGLSQTGLSQTGLSQTGLSQTGLSQTGLSQTGLSQTGSLPSLNSSYDILCNQQQQALPPTDYTTIGQLGYPATSSYNGTSNSDVIQLTRMSDSRNSVRAPNVNIGILDYTSPLQPAANSINTVAAVTDSTSSEFGWRYHTNEYNNTPMQYPPRSNHTAKQRIP